MGGWSHRRAQEAGWGGGSCVCVCVTEIELEQGQDRRKAKWADRILRGLSRDPECQGHALSTLAPPP